MKAEIQNIAVAPCAAIKRTAFTGDLKAVTEFFSEKKMNILITAGGTREYIDSVRFISNISTGKTACAIADFLAKKHDIIYLGSEGAKLPKNKKIKIKKFTDFKNLNTIFKNILGNKKIDAIIHSAAVSDYSILHLKTAGKKIHLKKNQKISSKNKELTIVLKKNFKIIDRIKTYSKNKKI
ncbi:MAG: phosphopantothenoylcysteine decarboxylase, partial [Elusimicrobiota bacterium]|nr:phosphopantothenoylcysteine decarboxylase [Elusimicrobiota bacterium]